MKWIGFIAAILGIITFVTNLASGWPINSLLSFWKHQLVKISSSDEFRVEAIYTSSKRVINPPDKFSYIFQLPLEARGVTSLDDSANIWVVLRDGAGGYYIQNPPVEIGNGVWTSNNIRPVHAIKRIIWLKVEPEGHSFFVRKRDHGEWGKFIGLPLHSTEVAYVDLR